MRLAGKNALIARAARGIGHAFADACVASSAHWGGVDTLHGKSEDKTPGQKMAEAGAAVPFGRMGTAEDLTERLRYRPAWKSDAIVAQTCNVDGGQWMS